MHVLQAPLGVIRRSNSQRLGIGLVPGRGHIGRLQVAADQPLFQLEPDHDVQIVRDFVRLDPDE